MDAHYILIIYSFIPIISLIIGYFARGYIEKRLRESAEDYAKRIKEEALEKAETIKDKKLFEAQAEITEKKRVLEDELRKKKTEVELLEKEISNQKKNLLEEKKRIEDSKRSLSAREKNLNQKEKTLKDLTEYQKKELERISGLTPDEAKEMLITTMKDEAKIESVKFLKKIEEEVKKISEKRAKKIVTLAIQKCASEQTTDSTVSSVELPTDEMKGRIIGREGRNIREFEKVAGVDLIVDDTPELVTISCHDPVRRETARVALEKLISDGRIHPARIEESISKAKAQVEKEIIEAGENAIFELGITGLAEELVRLLGRLKFRSSFGQNVLKHSIECAHLAGIIASEIGANPAMAKRCALLHDIGKAVDHNIEGSHAVIGAQLAEKYGEVELVINAIKAHHGEEEYKTIESIITQVADAISASRPGARRENLELYLNRIKKLEEISNSFEGVNTSYAIQAGRELRIFVDNQEVSDEKAYLVAKDIASKIEQELKYPGQIKVTVIRETKVVEYAK